jgi:hypothetical protein
MTHFAPDPEMTEADWEAARKLAEEAKLTCLCTGLSGNKFCRKHNDGLS